ncbi:efflux RND transporter periplasmic adaptor subunit [Anaerobacillus sp. CMMVII]|uniref:efflux RND transporter periplasmic adaptor subunit n=1 Tax=Anaerobacillus sp. CMMVII TaxID=2755588 RepID=UPI0021B7724A|nr:efflux RND transporter periplasmic adaptor subunit [Anaerobacillus sp. CMMVII]MCT8138018.1 efflux RND transporter periplasmic adaptor subunit [Anaerobacillus sp. CMMVII]
MVYKKQLSLLILVIGLLALVGCNTESSTQAEETVEPNRHPVEIAMVEKGVLTSDLKLSGNVMAGKQLPVLPLVAGEVKVVHVKNGDTVKRGDVLIEIDVSDIELSVSQARAGLEAAEANLRGSKAMREQSIRQAELQVAQTKELHSMLQGIENTEPVALENIPEELQEIFKRLLQSNMPTEADVKQAKTAVQQAEMALAQAKRTEQIDAATASVKQAKIAVEMAEKQKNNAVVTAPIDGQITNFTTSVGALVSPQMPLLQLVQMDEPVVHLNVSEAMLANISVDQEVEVQIRSLNQSYQGKITYIGIMPAEQSRAYPVEVVLANPDNHLRVGLLAEVILTPAIVNEELLVPVSAVSVENDERVIYVTRDGETVEKRIISIIGETTEWFSVENGLIEGEYVVVRGTHQLYDGAFINIRNDVGQKFDMQLNYSKERDEAVSGDESDSSEDDEADE